ncbi:MAG: adenine phosphoribosyltransferase [Bacteroidota bacterium]
MNDLSTHIRSIPNFPKQGINFKDITTLLKDPGAFRTAVSLFTEHYASTPVDKVVGIESRGFILGAALAHELGAGFVPVRKPGKLPAPTFRQEYKLEYGVDCIEIHKDAIRPGERILIHDDLLATGGTAAATCILVEQMKGSILGLSFLVELSFLKGRDRLKPHNVFSLIQYDAE